MKSELELLKIIYNNCCHPGCSHEGESDGICEERFYRAMAELIVNFNYPNQLMTKYQYLLQDIKENG